MIRLSDDFKTVSTKIASHRIGMLFYIAAFCANNTMGFDFSCKLSILKETRLEQIWPEETDAFMFMSSSADDKCFMLCKRFCWMKVDVP